MDEQVNTWLPRPRPPNPAFPVSPMGVDHLAQGQLTAHSQVGLVLCQTGCRALDGVHLTVLLRLIQSTNKFPWEEAQRGCHTPRAGWGCWVGGLSEAGGWMLVSRNSGFRGIKPEEG